MSKTPLRQFQDHVMNSGWRIQLIPHDAHPTKALRYPTNWVALILLVPFLASIYASSRRSDPRYLLGAVLSMGLVLVAILVAARKNRRGWVKVTGRCIDRELRSGATKHGPTWAWRWLCEFELDGQHYQVTPAYWLTWGKSPGKKQAEAFDRKVIAPDGSVVLWVNPRNPLQTEIAGRDIKDWLLH